MAGRPRRRRAAAAGRRPCACSAPAAGGVAVVPAFEQDDAWRLGRGKLSALAAYGQKVFGVRDRLMAVGDQRQEPVIAPGLVATSMFWCGMLREPSLNRLEPRLREPEFIRLAGALPEINTLGSADTMSRSLRSMPLADVRAVSLAMIAKAERNKVFREGWYGTLRYVALDGWEPICSWHQHCGTCLVRQIKVKRRDGTIAEVPQYYHRYAVAMLIDERFDLALDIEPLLPHDLRPSGAAKDDEDEGELTAARRLLRRVKQTFPWVDVVVADALYANGPFLTDVQQLRMSAVVIAKKDGDEPLKEALHLWRDQPPHEVVEDREAKERIELWDCPGLETLMTYRGPIRVVRGRVTATDAPHKPPSTWCMLVTGKKATRLPARSVLAVARARWHIENTAFHQWVTRWRFAHVFVHDGHGILAVYWLFIAAFNLLTLFLYRQLRCYGRDRGKDVTRTISRLVDEMRDDLARLERSPWDTS